MDRLLHVAGITIGESLLVLFDSEDLVEIGR